MPTGNEPPGPIARLSKLVVLIGVASQGYVPMAIVTGAVVSRYENSF